MIKFGGIKRTTVYLTLLTVVMFGFGYALVPLYDVFCEVTGLNGKTRNESDDSQKSSTQFGPTSLLE